MTFPEKALINLRAFFLGKNCDKIGVMKIIATVKPGSSQEKIVEGERDGDVQNVTIWVHARAHDGEANKKVVELLADFYGVSKNFS